MGGWRDPQLQMSENYSNLTKWRSTILRNLVVSCHVWFLQCSKASMYCANKTTRKRDWWLKGLAQAKIIKNRWFYFGFFWNVRSIFYAPNWFDVMDDWHCICCKPASRVGHCASVCCYLITENNNKGLYAYYTKIDSKNKNVISFKNRGENITWATLHLQKLNW